MPACAPLAAFLFDLDRLSSGKVLPTEIIIDFKNLYTIIVYKIKWTLLAGVGDNFQLFDYFVMIQ